MNHPNIYIHKSQASKSASGFIFYTRTYTYTLYIIMLTLERIFRSKWISCLDKHAHTSLMRTKLPTWGILIPFSSLPACAGSQMLTVALRPCPLWHQDSDLMSWEIPCIPSFWAMEPNPPVYDLLLGSPLRSHDNMAALALYISSTQTSPFSHYKNKANRLQSPKEHAANR